MSSISPQDQSSLSQHNDSNTTALHPTNAISTNKRKSAEPPSPPAPPGKKPRPNPKPTSTELYRHLLNDYIHDITHPHDVEDHHHSSFSPLQPSQIGCTHWTSLEKASFFNALSRLGKDATPSIASRIGNGKSKSSLEVFSYIRLLQTALQRHCSHAAQYRLLGTVDFPAAFEISAPCCAALEREADELNTLLARDEQRKGEKKWGHYWLLTSEIAQDIELALSEDGDDGLRKVREVVLPAELLKLETWLELSKGVFMNPSHPREDENWRNVAAAVAPRLEGEEGDEKEEEGKADEGEDELKEPAMHFTTFQDFANLTVSITERLVQGSLLCAMSRCRAMDDDSENHSRNGFKGVSAAVEPEDVQAACKVLKMSSDSREFWIGAPRRAGVEVYRLVKEWEGRVETARPMTYDDVEDELSGRRIWKEVMTGNTTKAGPAAKQAGEDDHPPTSSKKRGEGSCSYEEDEALGSDYSASDSSTSSSSSGERGSATERSQAEETAAAEEEAEEEDDDEEETHDLYNTDSETGYTNDGRRRAKIHRQHDLFRAQDRYMELVDQKNSTIEETRLWKDILGRRASSPLNITSAEGIELPKKPHQIRKEAAEVVDWRDRMEYWSEWETLSKRIPEQVFELAQKEDGNMGEMTGRIGRKGTGSGGMRVLRSKTRTERGKGTTLDAYWKPAAGRSTSGHSRESVDDAHNEQNDDDDEEDDKQRGQ